MSWFSLVIGQNASRQLATSSENLVASAQVLVALATSESQFRALESVVLFARAVVNWRSRFVAKSAYFVN